jgi:hypothetical protein
VAFSTAGSLLGTISVGLGRHSPRTRVLRSAIGGGRRAIRLMSPSSALLGQRDAIARSCRTDVMSRDQVNEVPDAGCYVSRNAPMAYLVVCSEAHEDGVVALKGTGRSWRRPSWLKRRTKTHKEPHSFAVVNLVKHLN